MSIPWPVVGGGAAAPSVVAVAAAVVVAPGVWRKGLSPWMSVVKVLLSVVVGVAAGSSPWSSV